MTTVINIHYDRTAPFEDMYLHFNFPQSFDTSKYRCLFKLQKVVWTFEEIKNKQITVVITKDIVDQLCPGMYKGLLQLVNDSEEFQNVLVQEFNISKEVESSLEQTIIIPVPGTDSDIEAHNLNPLSHPYLLNQISSINNELDTYGDIVTHNANEFYSSSNPNHYVTIDFLNPFPPLQYDSTNGHLWVKNTHQITTTGEIQQIYNNQANITQEITNRTNADNALQNNINTEASTRSAADNTLQSNLGMEEASRISADNALQDNIDTEAATRSSAVNTLQTNINNEATTRASADTTLQDNIDAEEQARTNADNTLQNNINTKVTKNNDITGATHTKITYDSKGLVTSGVDLIESDVPNLHLSKITDVTATASEVNILDGITSSTAELNILDGATLTTTELNYVDGATSNIQTQLNSKVNTADIINDTSHTDTNKPLSANIGKELQDEINNLKSLGRYLSTWNCATGLAGTDPITSPYTYHTGDYFLIGAVASSGNTNFRPNGPTYTIGVASTTIETETVNINDVYIYDGTTWKLQINSGRTVTFESLAGSPYDNSNLASSLNAKVTGNNSITGATKTKITYDSKGLVTSGSNLEADDIPNLTLSKISDVTAAASEVNVLDGIIASTTELNYVDGVTSNIQTQLDSKQANLTAGNNIQISNNTISATDTTYTAGTGISIVNNVISNTQTSAEWGNISGDIEDQEDLQLALDNKVTKNVSITAGTKCKITYDSKGLVTNGADLQTSDIPNLNLAKITDVTASVAEVNILDGATLTTTELNVLDGITATTTELNYCDGVTSNIQTQIDNKAQVIWRTY